MRAGFTLVEILVVTVLLALVGGVAFTLSSTGQAVWTRTDTKLANMTDAQRAIDRLSEDLRKACWTTVSPQTGCQTTALTFKQLPCGAADPVLTYAQAGTSLTRQVGATAAVVVASGIQDFTHCESSGDVGGIVRLSLTTQANPLVGPSVRTVESRIWVQNNPS
ncbi:MAG: prepilin-type N-terminal cleavage/methylation domain-containing protein [Candidatus Omnitrophica bacterium]|nr:prepilin-type N-terminal cleavage/methylation domain-containing protein [Candidatus Omnitrophota bacterium]